MRQKTSAALVAVAVGISLASASAAETLVDRVRIATERFADVDEMALATYFANTPHITYAVFKLSDESPSANRRGHSLGRAAAVRTDWGKL